jgi:hypothetical protein
MLRRGHGIPLKSRDKYPWGKETIPAGTGPAPIIFLEALDPALMRMNEQAWEPSLI